MKKKTIAGRCLLPATSYLHLVRETIVYMTPGQNFNGLNIEFENIKFLRATTLTPTTKVSLTIVIHIGSGDFEISEGTTAVMSGNVKVIENAKPVTDLSTLVKADENPIVLNCKDFYKELRLRGYNYAGIFRSVVEANSNGTFGRIKWQQNWASFMDCMLQINILSLDSRTLFLPTSIRKIRINTEEHLAALAQLDPEDPILEVKMCKEFNMVTCGGIEMIGLSVNSVARRKPPGTEILETYQFIPYNCESIEQTPYDAVSIIIQIGQENLLQQKIKIIELDGNIADMKPLIQIFDDAIINVPMVFADLIFLRRQEEKVEIEHVTVEDSELKAHTNCQYIILSKALKDDDLIAQAKTSLADKGFLILREDKNLLWNDIEVPSDFNLISLIKTSDETLILLQRKPTLKEKTFVKVVSKDMNFEWLEPLRNAAKTKPTIIYEQGDFESGILGLANCLRREPGTDMRCVFIDDKTAPTFDSNNSFYSEQIKLDLAVNIYRNGLWGTYRHITLRTDDEEIERSGHYYANLLRYGDLSTFKWMSGSTYSTTKSNLVHIQYSSINFRDVMVATGRLPIEIQGSNRSLSQCFLGFEFSGINAKGEKVMGMVKTGAMSTQIETNLLTLKAPQSMSLRDAATIPVVYGTIYYAFFFYRPISKGKSMLAKL